MFIKLFVKEISDEFSQENFKRIELNINSFPLNKGNFFFFEFTFDSAATNKRIPHNLGFRPKDILQTAVSNGAVVTWNYELFDASFLDVTVSAPCKVRVFVGCYKESA